MEPIHIPAFDGDAIPSAVLSGPMIEETASSSNAARSVSRRLFVPSMMPRRNDSPTSAPFWEISDLNASDAIWFSRSVFILSISAVEK
jgi:hypothetical protein